MRWIRLEHARSPCMICMKGLQVAVPWGVLARRTASVKTS
jgi:hypothetical protein